MFGAWRQNRSGPVGSFYAYDPAVVVETNFLAFDPAFAGGVFVGGR